MCFRSLSKKGNLFICGFRLNKLCYPIADYHRSTFLSLVIQTMPFKLPNRYSLRHVDDSIVYMYMKTICIFSISFIVFN